MCLEDLIELPRSVLGIVRGEPSVMAAAPSPLSPWAP